MKDMSKLGIGCYHLRIQIKHCITSADETAQETQYQDKTEGFGEKLSSLTAQILFRKHKLQLQHIHMNYLKKYFMSDLKKKQRLF